MSAPSGLTEQVLKPPHWNLFQEEIKDIPLAPAMTGLGMEETLQQGVF